MAIRRRRPAPKAAQAPTSRVHALDTLEQWEKMLAKAAAAKRLVCVQFYQAQNYTCAQMRAYYRRMSVDPALKAAVFAEVEVDAAEDELLYECGLGGGTAKIPLYQCWVAGEMVQSYAGGVPAEVAKMLATHLAELKGSGGGLLSKLLLAAAAAAAAAAAYWQFGRRQGGGSSGGGGDKGSDDLGAQMRSLSERINIAQQRLRAAERGGRLKAAKNQRRILQQLRSQQKQLEQRLQQRQQPGGGGRGGRRARVGGAADEAPASDGEPEGGSPRRKARGKRRGGSGEAHPPGWYSSDDEAPPRPRPAVLYSDEDED